MIPQTYCYRVSTQNERSFLVFAYKREDVHIYMKKQYPDETYTIDEWFVVYAGLIHEYK